MSKALGSSGGYIAGCKDLVQHLRYTAPSFVFAVGISPPTCAAALAAIRLLEAHPNASHGSEARRTVSRTGSPAGLEYRRKPGTPIVPVIIGNSMLN